MSENTIRNAAQCKSKKEYFKLHVKLLFLTRQTVIVILHLYCYVCYVCVVMYYIYVMYVMYVCYVVYCYVLCVYCYLTCQTVVPFTGNLITQPLYCRS